jgi:hypothetical protein
MPIPTQLPCLDAVVAGQHFSLQVYRMACVSVRRLITTEPNGKQSILPLSTVSLPGKSTEQQHALSHAVPRGSRGFVVWPGAAGKT